MRIWRATLRLEACQRRWTACRLCRRACGIAAAADCRRRQSPQLPLPPLLTPTECTPQQEIDVELSPAYAGGEPVVQLSLWLGRVAAACASTLRSLRLAGPLHLGLVFQALTPLAAQFTQLEVRGSVLMHWLLGWPMAAHSGDIHPSHARSKSTWRAGVTTGRRAWRPRRCATCRPSSACSCGFRLTMRTYRRRA